MCWRFGIGYPPKKLRRSNVIAQSTLRGGHVYCLREKAIRSFTSTCTHGGGNDCKRHVKSILLLSLNAHNHVDDYSGTLGGVRKVHISALVTSPKNWVVALSFILCLSLSQKKKKKKKKKNKRTSWLVSGRHVTQKCQQSLPLLHQWRVSCSPWWCGVKRNRLGTAFWWWWG